MLKKSGLCVLAVLLSLTAGSVLAADYYVSTTGDDVSGDGSAGNPWKTIQHAVDNVVAGDIIHVAAGTYVEQVEITKNITVRGAGATTIVQSPATLTKFFTTSNNNYPVIYVHDASSVSIKNLTLDGNGQGNSNYRFVGIGYHNAGGLIDSVEVKGIRNTPINGSQHGIGIYAYAQSGTARSITVQNCTIYDFQKNGCVFSGNDLTATASDNNITGAGPVDFIAQNGIQISYGATGSVTYNTVSNISYTPASYVSVGLLLYIPSGTITSTGNTINECEVGIYYIDVGGLISSNVVNISAAGVGVSDFWGIVADPGDIIRAIPNPFDPPSPKASKAQSPIYTPAAVFNTTIDQNILTGDGNGVGLEFDATGSNTLNVTATQNTIDSWSYGIYVYKDSTATINATVNNCNKIINNTTYGLFNSTGDSVTATNNWWGSATGPGGVGPGTGDAVSADVVYDPWGSNSICDQLIPVELTSFSASTTAEGVRLSWSTATETENLGFHVYRSQAAEGDYEQISTQMIPGQGNSSEQNNYEFIDKGVETGTTYFYKLADIDYNGELTMHGPVSVTVSPMPTEFVLEQNFPNPFNPSTTINFSLPEANEVTLAIYTTTGQLVRTLVRGQVSAGNHSVSWNALDDSGARVASGVYLYTLKTSSGVLQKKKLILMK